MTNSDAVLATAVAAADLARTITLSWFRQEVQVETKQDASPVTVADRHTEEAIRRLIEENHPDHGFFGEEGGNQTNNEEWQWIVDPIDGTKSFTTGKPTFGTLIAAIRNGVPQIGLIDHPALDERWIGQAGKPTLYNGRECSTSTVSSVSEATAYCTTIDMFNDNSFKQFNQLTTQCRFRAFGGDCYCYGLLSSGLTDLVCEADLKPYDFMALVPVIEGAGGIISDWQGQALTPDSGDQVIAAANPELHRQAILFLQADNS